MNRRRRTRQYQQRQDDCEPSGDLGTIGKTELSLKSGILFISLKELTKYKDFPRNPECASICTDLVDIDRHRSLMVFVSHSWIAGSRTSELWRGQPHPDYPDDSKFKLTLSGLNEVWRSMAPNMDDCYVWIDFACVNQDTDPCDELRHLDKIIGCCDIIYTPLVNRLALKGNNLTYSTHEN
jgi:hypothetical protein